MDTFVANNLELKKVTKIEKISQIEFQDQEKVFL
jgi:hypothetical protein